MKLTTHFPENTQMQQGVISNHINETVVIELLAHFGAERFTIQSTRTGIPILWVSREMIQAVLSFL